MTYIYIFEDGEICQSETGPTPMDLNCIENGYLTVLSTNSKEPFKYIGRTDLDTIPEAYLNKDDNSENLYHSPIKA